MRLENILITTGEKQVNETKKLKKKSSDNFPIS